jgi:hypothetical protein
MPEVSQMRFRLTLFVLAFAVLCPISAANAASFDSPEVVASGLDNPRGLDVGPTGIVYVAEAGRGGNGPCVEAPEGEGEDACVGFSGAITKVSVNGRQTRFIKGLPSIAIASGDEAAGPQDFALGRFGGAWIPVGLGGDPAERAKLGPVGKRLGKLYRVIPGNKVEAVVDVAAFEGRANPDGKVPDSNPNSAVNEGLARRAVVDAGGNTLLRVGPQSRLSTLAVFPDRPVDFPAPDFPMEAVPTSVVVGPDNAYYVGQLTGFPFLAGAARVYRVQPGGQPQIHADGFTNITDIAFGPDGELYVVEFATNGLLSGDPTGALKVVNPDGSQETIASEGLQGPTGVAVDRKGNVYVSNRGFLAGAGEVLKFEKSSQAR